MHGVISKKEKDALKVCALGLIELSYATFAVIRNSVSTTRRICQRRKKFETLLRRMSRC